MLKSVRECMSKDIATDAAESAAACRYSAGVGQRQRGPRPVPSTGPASARARRALLSVRAVEQAHKASLTGAPLTARAAKHLRFLHGAEGSNARQRFYGPQTAYS